MHYTKVMISFVYFDVGGVVIKDFTATNKWAELEAEMGVTLEQSVAFKEFWRRHEGEVCEGKDLESLVPLLRQELNLPLPPNFSFLHGFVSRFYKNESLWPVIQAVKAEVPVGLLTNMYTNMLDAIKDKGILPNVTWNAVIDSSVETVRKPNKEIYQLAAERAHVVPEEILFIDNTQRHLDGAAACGWQTYFYDSVNFEKSSRELLEFFQKVRT